MLKRNTVHAGTSKHDATEKTEGKVGRQKALGLQTGWREGVAIGDQWTSCREKDWTPGRLAEPIPGCLYRKSRTHASTRTNLP